MVSHALSKLVFLKICHCFNTSCEYFCQPFNLENFHRRALIMISIFFINLFPELSLSYFSNSSSSLLFLSPSLSFSPKLVRFLFCLSSPTRLAHLHSKLLPAASFSFRSLVSSHYFPTSGQSYLQLISAETQKLTKIRTHL